MPEEENKTVTAPPSEQAAPRGASPSEQGKTAEGSTAPATGEKTPEKRPEVDLEAIRRDALEEARQKVRHDVESEYGKKLSEVQRLERERSNAEREQLLSRFGQYVPDDELQSVKKQYEAAEVARRQAQESEQVKAELTYYRQQAEFTRAVQEADVLVRKAGYELSELPAEVKGDSPVGFKDRFTDYLAAEAARLKKKLDADTKKAAEDATRETERKLGVTTVSGGSPVGKGGSDLAGLRQKLRDAHARGDEAAIEKFGREIEEEVYRRR